jgi:uncharacterized protein (DUF58 family)
MTNPRDVQFPSEVAVSLADLVRLRFGRGFSLLPRQPVQSLLAGQHASRLRGRGLDFEELRRYQPGDDVRQIDWKATVRTRKTQTRVLTEERERPALLLVDQRRSMFFGSVRYMKSVIAAQAAALAAWRVLQQKDRVGTIVFNDSRFDVVRPQRSQSTVMRSLQAVVDQNQALAVSRDGEANPGAFNNALHRASQLAAHDYLVCIISDGAGANDESRELLTRIAEHNDVVFVFVYDPLEAELPDGGPLVFGDEREQLEVDTSQPRLRAEFQAAFADERASGRKFLLQRETPVLPLSTAEDAAAQLGRQLGGARK